MVTKIETWEQRSRGLLHRAGRHSGTEGEGQGREAFSKTGGAGRLEKDMFSCWQSLREQFNELL